MLLVVVTTSAIANDDSDIQTRIDNYVSEGLNSNIALQTETLEVEKSVQALAIARARYLPTAELHARYSRAEGGRTIDLPLGQTLNPVYGTLNQLLAQQGQVGNFPQVADQTIPFIRSHEQDTRIAVRQPLFAPGIPAAVRAQKSLLNASRYRRIAVARALQRDITVAYVEWMKARQAVGIVDASATLLKENVRVNQSLFNNGKVTQDAVLSADAELLGVVQQQREAQGAVDRSMSYFNFLLNRDPDTAIDAANVPGQLPTVDEQLAVLTRRALQDRPELTQVADLARASDAQVAVAGADLWPTLALGVDAGTQGEDYRFGPGYNFAIASLQLTWRFYDGGNYAKLRQARAQERQATLRQDQTRQQIQLEVQDAFIRFAVARDSLATADARVNAARSAFRIASRKREEGVISQVEYLDARRTLTTAELNLNVTRFDALARRADLEYVTASSVLPVAFAAGS